MRSILRALVCFITLLTFKFTDAQQVAKTIASASSPIGRIGFLEFRPSDYGSQKHPLIIFLHGIGERGNGIGQISSVAQNGPPNLCANGATMRFTVNGQTSSFVVLSPQLAVQYGYWPTYYVKEMIAYAKANLSIDPNRIYVTGLSLGGGGVWRLITDTENYDNSFDGTIAAAAPVCGTQEEVDADFCRTIGDNHLPVWAFHSMDDGTVSVNATQHAEIIANMCGITPAIKFTYYQNGGHGGAWLNAYDTGHITRTISNGTNFTPSLNLYEWFLSNSRNANIAPQTYNYTVPTVNAGAAQTITSLDGAGSVTLNGSAAGTNGATISSYAWTKTSGPSSGIISSASSASTTVTGMVQGSYVFTLTATDNHGLTSSSTVSITVIAISLTIPSVNAGVAQIITSPDGAGSVTLNGSAAGTNGASIASYSWTKTSGPSSGTISSPSSASTTVTGLAQGVYVFTLTVSDNRGLSSSSTVSITVIPLLVSRPAPAPNQAPVAVASLSASTITLPTNSVTLDGSGSYDADGSITSYAWTQTAGPGAQLSGTNSAKTTVNGLTAGNYNFVLQVSDNSGATGTTNVGFTVNDAPAQATNQPIGYLKQSVGYYQACGDASTSGRIPIYSNGLANGNLVYLDAGLTKLFDGGFNWYSFTQTLGGVTSYALSVFPDGTIHLLAACSSSSTLPVTTPVTQSNLLGYIKISYGPYQACDDASSSGRMAIYGKSIANGSYLYLDAAMTQLFDGGWNWYSFTPTLGGKVTSAFAVYPIGTMGLLFNCSNGSRTAAGSLTDNSIVTATGKLNIYPNPIHSSATIELSSLDNGAKTINIYNANGILAAKYNWQTVKGTNTFQLKNIAGLPGGLYIADIRDNNGKPVGKVKFIKQ